jgi:hypothetical protein
VLFSLKATLETVISMHVELLNKGGYIPTSEDIQCLVARGGTVQDTLEIAKDVARRLLDAQS